MAGKGLLERLNRNETVLIAEGYLMELERRGFVKAETFTPEMVLDHPQHLKNLHEEFVLAGSDVVEAYTYKGNRDKLKTVQKDDETEKLNRTALRIAREVANEHGKLMAGNICNTWLYVKGGPDGEDEMTSIFKDQIEWAVEEGADFIIAETYGELREALLALKCIKQYGNGLPAVVTITPYVTELTFDGVSFPEACRKLEEAGADVVGLNCGRGPATMMPLLKEVKKVCKGPIAALPVAFRTDNSCKTYQALVDPKTGTAAYPLDLDALRSSKRDIREFAIEAKTLGIQYVGLCCGNAPNLMREVAEAFDRKPPASQYSLTDDKIFGYTSNEASNRIKEHQAGKDVLKLYK